MAQRSGADQAQITLRLPDTLHLDARLRAEQEGVSLNQWLVYAISVASTRPDLVNEDTAAEALLLRLRGGRTAEEARAAADRWLASRKAAVAKAAKKTATKAYANRPPRAGAGKASTKRKRAKR